MNPWIAACAIAASFVCGAVATHFYEGRSLQWMLGNIVLRDKTIYLIISDSVFDKATLTNNFINQTEIKGNVYQSAPEPNK